THLAVLVPSPALDPAGDGQGAGLTAAGAHGADAARQPGDNHWCRAVGGRPIAQLALAVIAPALDPACGGQDAGVIHSTVVTSGTHGADTARQPRDVHWRRPIADIASVAQRSTHVRAPALDTA